MRRRDFIKVIAGSAAAWPLVARAQQQALPVVAFMRIGSPDASTGYVAAFRKGLNESGYVEGQNVTVEYHWLAEFGVISLGQGNATTRFH
jgi:putative tryptophan/tyrosine transport system substrate-binding protein